MVDRRPMPYVDDSKLGTEASPNGKQPERLSSTTSGRTVRSPTQDGHVVVRSQITTDTATMKPGYNEDLSRSYPDMNAGLARGGASNVSDGRKLRTEPVLSPRQKVGRVYGEGSAAQAPKNFFEAVYGSADLDNYQSDGSDEKAPRSVGTLRQLSDEEFFDTVDDDDERFSLGSEEDEIEPAKPFQPVSSVKTVTSLKSLGIPRWRKQEPQLEEKDGLVQTSSRLFADILRRHKRGGAADDQEPLRRGSGSGRSRRSRGSERSSHRQGSDRGSTPRLGERLGNQRGSDPLGNPRLADLKLDAASVENVSVRSERESTGDAVGTGGHLRRTKISKAKTGLGRRNGRQVSSLAREDEGLEFEPLDEGHDDKFEDQGSKSITKLLRSRLKAVNDEYGPASWGSRSRRKLNIPQRPSPGGGAGVPNGGSERTTAPHINKQCSSPQKPVASWKGKRFPSGIGAVRGGPFNTRKPSHVQKQHDLTNVAKRNA